ncbi:MAG TPA: efflux RND transporter periplasmic adaptor subunit [Kofleriaceae bacterium]|nr:efflux RND transporter periplasmic adaptor subunit [Kofleriaceae bacterium]
MRALWTTATILALAAALTACKKNEDGGAEKAAPPPPVKVALVAVEEAPSPQQLVLTGMVAADQRSEVTADTQGKVLNVMVERGQRVKMGAPVVQLDVRTSALAAREAQANLASARAQRELAEQECARTKQLLDKGAITRSEYDRQTTQCTSALQQVSAAEARAQMMTKSVADGIVRAPFDGVVAQKSVSPGEFVSPGRPLFTLVDDDPLKIELSVPEAEVHKIKEGQEVELVAVAAPDQAHKAKVTRIGAEIGRTRSLIVEATIAPGSGLVPGMFAEARVTTGEAARPVVPKDAVVKRGKIWHAFVVVKGEVQDRIVQIAPAADPAKVAIVQGVTKGEQVVAKVTEQIVDGLRVAE